MDVISEVESTNDYQNWLEERSIDRKHWEPLERAQRILLKLIDGQPLNARGLEIALTNYRNKGATEQQIANIKRFGEMLVDFHHYCTGEPRAHPVESSTPLSLVAAPSDGALRPATPANTPLLPPPSPANTKPPGLDFGAPLELAIDPQRLRAARNAASDNAPPRPTYSRHSSTPRRRDEPTFASPAQVTSYLDTSGGALDFFGGFIRRRIEGTLGKYFVAGILALAVAQYEKCTRTKPVAQVVDGDEP